MRARGEAQARPVPTYTPRRGRSAGWLGLWYPEKLKTPRRVTKKPQASRRDPGASGAYESRGRVLRWRKKGTETVVAPRGLPPLPSNTSFPNGSNQLSEPYDPGHLSNTNEMSVSLRSYAGSTDVESEIAQLAFCSSRERNSLASKRRSISNSILGRWRHWTSEGSGPKHPHLTSEG